MRTAVVSARTDNAISALLRMIPIGPFPTGRARAEDVRVTRAETSASDHPEKTKPSDFSEGFENGAGEETRTLDVHLGKVVLYPLSYARGDEGAE